jgi:hypothetical protein
MRAIPPPGKKLSTLGPVQRCPRCERSVAAEAAFCPYCGAQLKVQPVQGEIIDGTDRFKKNRAINPGRAARLSLIPGLGHWYAGAPVKGLAFFAAIVGPLVIGTELDLTVVAAPLGIPLDLGGLGLWAFCAYDAYRTAKNRMRPPPESQPGTTRSAN